VISGTGLKKVIGGRTLVEGVSLRVERGEVVGLLGPNGAGKTTTIRMLLGVLRPDAGRVSVDGPVGYLPEVFPPYEALSVEGYLRFMARMKRLDPGAVVGRAMEAARVTDISTRPIGRLSRGQRQRTGLAQALLGDPPNLVLDEPTAGLDPQQIAETRAAIAGRREGTAILFSTHVLAEAAAVCDRVVVMARGRVLATEAPGDLRELEDRFLRLVGEAEIG